MRRLFGLLAFVAACGTDGDAPTIDGTWHGHSGDQDFDLSIAQLGAAITGAGTIAPGNLTGKPFGVQVSGAIDDTGKFSMNLDTGGNGSVTYSGGLIDDELYGTLAGSG